MLELQPFGILLASCRLEMNNGRQHRQLSAPLAPSSPSPCPPGTPQVPATWKINPPASLITVMCQEPCSRSVSRIPVINSLQFAAALLGRSRVAAARGRDEHPGTSTLGIPGARGFGIPDQSLRTQEGPGWVPLPRAAGSLDSPRPLVYPCAAEPRVPPTTSACLQGGLARSHLLPPHC